MNERVAGVDLGKASAKLIILRPRAGQSVEVEFSECVRHEGRPLEIFTDWYAQQRLFECSSIGATGLFADQLVAPITAGLPEDACLEEALLAHPELSGPINVVNVSARGYSALSRDESGRVQHASSDKCSSGTGETLVKTALRFGCSLEESDKLAFEAEAAIPITARCSVFAKSEMTHFGNQGKPKDQLFRGYFDSIARYVAALLGRVQVDGPVLLLGGGSRLRTLTACLEQHSGARVITPSDFAFWEAMGAAHVAAAQGDRGSHALPQDPAALVATRRVRFEVLRPARESQHRVTILKSPPAPEAAKTQPCVLGLDLGSTGSKAVLTAVDGGQMLHDVYDRTRGNPVDAAQRLVGRILDELSVDVRAIGVTGSGREAAATVLRAAFPEHEARIVVVNEIVAHGTAAIRCDARGGESLSVVEIGGQDAKFIQIVDGQIVESDMNKACSAGTGSFLEEQAVFYGVHDIGEFTELAQRAERPPDLGQMCTVFVAEAAAEAHAEGFSIADLFGGFQYSVVHNYLNRVMGQRTLGKRVFFQGKPASGESLAWTLAAVSGREVIVPAKPGEMGAWGIGLCAIRDLGEETLKASPRIGLDAFLGANVVDRGEIRCRDARCQTLCTIDRTTVQVLGKRHVVSSGGACPKFEVSTKSRAKLPQDAPSAFDERRELVARYAVPRPGPVVVGVPHVGALAGFLPWAVTFLSELGLGVRVLSPDSGSLSRGEERCYSYDACAPVKVAHSVADANVDQLFVPKLLDIPDRDGEGGKTCNLEQALAEMLRESLKARGRDVTISSPVVELAQGFTSPAVVVALSQVAKDFGVDLKRVPAAAVRAGEAQAAYERELSSIGRRTLAYSRATGIPVVVVCGTLHVIFDPVVSAGIPAIVRQNGTLALPMDCYPLSRDDDQLQRAVWADARRTLRVAVAARARGDVFPLLIASFGCGPSSFLEQTFDRVLQGYPHSALESDGHGGNAGFVTRVQAFLHGVQSYEGGPSPAEPAVLERLTELETRPLDADRDARLVVLPIADRLGGLAAAAYRSMGYDAVCAGPTSREAFATGRKDCSGKECLPYQLIWGSFRKQLEDEPPQKSTVLVQVQGQGACRNCMFSLKDQASLDHMGLSDIVAVRHLGSESNSRTSYLTRFWGATVAWDILNQLLAYHRPATDAANIEELYSKWCDRLERMVERPQPSGMRAVLERGKWSRELVALVHDAAQEFSKLARHDRNLRTALLTGDIYLRVDEFASDDIVRKLNERGLRVVVDPACVLVEYLIEEYSAELLGMPTGLFENSLMRLGMRGMRKGLYSEAQKYHPWLPMPDVPAALQAARPLIGRYPQGEAPMTVGTVLHAWERRDCDGVLVISPWGCGPALIAESLLRHQGHIPALFIYSDGTPLDDRRLNGFAYRLRRQPRTGAPAMRSEGQRPEATWAQL